MSEEAALRSIYFLWIASQVDLLGAPRFPFIFEMEGFFYEKKSLAHRPFGHRDPHVHRQRLCLERIDSTGDGDHGAYFIGNHLGFFYCHSFLGHVGRILRTLGGAHGAFAERTGVGGIFCVRPFGDCLGGACPFSLDAIFLLWRYRRYRPWRGLHHAGVYAGKVVSQSSRLCDGARYHGIWLRGARGRAGYALLGGALWAHRKFPALGFGVWRGDDSIRFLYPSAEEGGDPGDDRGYPQSGRGEEKRK